MNAHIQALFSRELDDQLERLETLGVALCEGSDDGAVAEALRILHTVKGNARMAGHPELSELAHETEEQLESSDTGLGDLLLAARDAMADARAPDSSQPEAEVQLRSSSLGTLYRQVVGARTDAGPAARDALGRVATELQRARERPPEGLVARLHRAVLDAGRLTNKTVELDVFGEDQPLEVELISVLSEVLPHVLRNAIDHGIETDDERRRLGKSVPARLTLSFRRHGGAIVVTSTDDGQGIDPDRIGQIAVERGVVTEERVAALTTHERVNLIFSRGLSSRSEVTALSGRGVGLDVVAERVREQNGSIEVESELGRGSGFEIRLPVGARSADCVVASLGDRVIAVPIGALTAILPPDEAPLPTEGLVDWDGQIRPLIGVREFDPHLGAPRPRWLLLLELEGAPLAMAVDEVLDLATLFLDVAQRPGMPWLAGAAPWSDRQIAWALDLGEIGRDWNRYTVPESPVVVVLDDSPLVGELATMVLDEAGYAATWVETPAEVKPPFDVLVTDLHLPDTSEAELTALVRRVREEGIPVILCTGERAEDAEAARERIGADAVVTKAQVPDLATCVASLLR